MPRLAGKTAIITGGAGGIGHATARLFAEEGARIALVDIDSSALDQVAASVREAVPGAEILAIEADVGQESAAGQIVARSLAAFGSLDILVNNAGIRSYEPLEAAKAETWAKVLSVNLLSYAYLAREALPALRRSGKGAIVNISSTHAFNPRAGMGQYDAAKAGIISLTKTLAFEEVDRGVRVNAVCPGLTLTPFHVRRFAAEGRSEQDLRTEQVDHNIQRRWADPREVAFPILWLASDEASFCTASVIMADGGTRV
ncbi:SDR family NAD(P)-dependent oxidoreductase [Bosea sp. BH3]|uniref:SDR family NAD(P)-dependent oxidoreductase n=1 Tax=Bosea sp. BH3 TaxID=2871701 RepID=UPI0021CB075B|nr:SDR family oxidoreductase [Bosea sp. BH3]MCU4179493.1 SDR family oxidoreductase [Bosea sp. BH3]